MLSHGCRVAAVVMFVSAIVRAGEFPREWFWGKDEQRAKHEAMEGQPAPELSLSAWMNGEVTAADMKGKIVVVDFWATWCGPCIGSIPKNNKIHEQYADKGVVLIGVCGSGSGQEKMADVVKDKGIKYPVAKDADQRSAPAWSVMWWPTYGVIDRTGKLRALGLKPDHVAQVVDKLLEEPAPKEERASETEDPLTATAAAE